MVPRPEAAPQGNAAVPSPPVASAADQSVRPAQEEETPAAGKSGWLERKPHQTTTSAPAEREHARADSFDGQWFWGAQVNEVRGNAVMIGTTEPQFVELRRLGPNACVAVSEPESMRGFLSEDGQRLTWDDGCVWTRTPPKQEKDFGARHAPPTAPSPAIPALAEVFVRPRARRRVAPQDASHSPRRQPQPRTEPKPSVGMDMGHDDGCRQDEGWDAFNEKIRMACKGQASGLEQSTAHLSWTRFVCDMNPQAAIAR
jgi:hypothetical protein